MSVMSLSLSMLMLCWICVGGCCCWHWLWLWLGVVCAWSGVAPCAELHVCRRGGALHEEMWLQVQAHAGVPVGAAQRCAGAGGDSAAGAGVADSAGRLNSPPFM